MQTVFFSTFYCRYQQQAMSTSTIPKIVTTMSSKNPSSPSSTTCKSVQQQDEQQHQQQQQQQQLQSSENNIVMKSFPWKLYLLLERCDYEKKYIYPTSTHAAIQWNMSGSINSDSDISDVGCGKSFIIQNKEKFTKDILPHFFKCANNTKNKNNSNNDDINNNDGRNFDIFQANIDMWYVLLRIVVLCCVVLRCVFPNVLSLYFLRFYYSVRISLLSCPLHSNPFVRNSHLSFVIIY